MARICLLAALFAIVPVARADEHVRRFAFLVGINEYQHLPRLEWAENDVADLAKTLTDGRYDEVVALTGKADGRLKATRANIAVRLSELAAKCGSDDLLLVALAGHGWQFGDSNSQCYFAPVDADPTNPNRAKTFFALSELYDILRTSKARTKLVLIDACRENPTMARGIGFHGRQEVEPGVHVLMSCSFEQRAYEVKKYQHGLFFYHILRGLRGENAAALDQNGNVDWLFLCKSVIDAVKADAPTAVGFGAKQHPNMLANINDTVAVLVRPRSAVKRALSIPRAVESSDRSLDLGGGVTIVCKRIDAPANKTYTLGSAAANPHPLEVPQVELPLANSYFLGASEVTVGQYDRFLRANGLAPPIDAREWADRLRTPDLPATYVRWDDAVAFCRWASQATGETVRLPYEVEWEYAAGAKFPHPRAASVPVQVGRLVPVTEMKPDDRGLVGMRGNAWEWCGDTCFLRYDVAAKIRYKPGQIVAGAPAGKRPVRGGAWNTAAADCTATRRTGFVPDHADGLIGFRVLVEAK
ncbi:MAG: SUMF1/EgtB/PvdO family nonheme iron enzyme [Gemmataceae bacterium]